MNRFFDECDFAASAETYEEQQRRFAALQAEFDQWEEDHQLPFEDYVRKLSRKEASQGVAHALPYRVPAFYFETKIRRDTQEHLMRLAIALCGYHDDHQRYPATLNDLVPDYVASIPMDEFTAGPYGYRATETSCTVYSDSVDGPDSSWPKDLEIWLGDAWPDPVASR